MLTRTFDYWAIRTDDDDRASSDKEFFDTFADAMAARMNYADWYCKKGECTIRHYRLSPDFQTLMVMDDIHLYGSGKYRMWMHNARAVWSEDPNARGNISDLPALFE